MRLEAGANHSSEKAIIFEPRGPEIRSYWFSLLAAAQVSRK